MFVDDDAKRDEDEVISVGRGGQGRNEISSVHFEVVSLSTRGADALRTAVGEAS